MGIGWSVLNPYVPSISGSTHWFSIINRSPAPPMHGAHRYDSGKEESVDLPLQCIRALECNHDVLGMQCYNRRRALRHFCQRVPNVTDFRIIQVEQKQIYRHAAIYLPHGNMDRMGTILLRCRNFMAMAGAWQLICQIDRLNSMV